jgi:hypothetical protein
MSKVLACIIAAFACLASSAQLKEIQLQQRAVNSDLIIEGKVVSQQSFWNTDQTMIYTSNRVEIFKIFKGNVSTDVIDILTIGGTVDLRRITTSSMLSLEVGETGIFLCETVKHFRALPAATSRIPRFEAYASEQGFIRYDLQKQVAADPFKQYNNIGNELYNVFSPSHNYREIRPFNIHTAPSTQRLLDITGFSPATITAGTHSVLTINGSGFGATQGAGVVRFRNADDGGATFITPLPSQYISWSDIQIQVEVPARAGTGTFQVMQGVTFTSASPLTISFAHLNVNFDPGPGTIAYETDHINDNGSGGYTWRMNTGFDANVAARASFVRAFDTWRCGTDINWTIGATTAINDAVSDGTNIICFDNTAPLSAGILGVCFSYWSGCASGPTIVWYVNELDIIFDEGSNLGAATWEFGPALPTFFEYDFETVAVHELGHGHQLGHVINSGAIMHYAISNGTANRTLGTNDLAGGNYVQAKSEVANICGPGPMAAFTGCATLPLTITSIKAFQKDNGIQVEWVNETESDVHHYEIEESSNGTDFTSSKSVAPKDNSSQRASYDWLDRNVNNNGINYYRVKSLGLSGRYEYSDIVWVKLARGKQKFNIYPNPVRGKSFNAELYGLEKGTYTLAIYNAAGQQVLNRIINHNGGNAVEPVTLPGLSAGIYRLQFTGNNIDVKQTLLVE